MGDMVLKTVYSWSVPKDIYYQLKDEFNFEEEAFPRQIDMDTDIVGYKELLERDWKRGTVFCCPPPRTNLYAWVKKCWLYGKDGNVAVMLLPARTDTRWFHEFCYNKPGVELRFLKGRLRYGNYEYYSPTPSMVVVFRRKDGK